MTDRAIEELCYSRNDASVVFDEEGRNSGGGTRSRDRRAKLAFMVPGGRGAIRSQRAAGSSDLSNLTWRLFGISSGEEPLERADARRRAGEQVRHIDIGVPPPSHAGIFDLLDGDVKEALRLAAQVERTIERNYGKGIRTYLAPLTIQRSAAAARVRTIVAEFIDDVGANSDPWERRFAQKFAIVAAGGILAAELGVAPFDAEHARRCVLRIYRVARRSVFSIEDSYTKVLARLRRAVVNKRRFPRIEKGEMLPRKLRDMAWGFRRELSKGREIIAVDPARFEAIAGSAPVAEAVLDRMIERRFAFAAIAGKRRPQIAVQGFAREGRPRWVCLRAAAF